MKQIEIDDVRIEIEKKKIKNMYLRILPPDGRVHVSAPVRMSDTKIKEFVQSKIDWIEVQQKKIKTRNMDSEINFRTGDIVPVWGKSCYLIVKEGQPQNNTTLLGDKLILSVKSNSTEDSRKKVIDNWYRKNLQEELPSLINKWEKIIGVTSEGFQIRDMKTRWGTCNVRTKRICFNLQLAKKKPICLEYVVVHELVHLLESSHNYVFKGYMDRFLPGWREIRKELNN